MGLVPPLGQYAIPFRSVSLCHALGGAIPLACWHNHSTAVATARNPDLGFLATPLRSHGGPPHHYVIPTLHTSASSAPWPRPTVGGVVREPRRALARFRILLNCSSSWNLTPWPRLGRSYPILAPVFAPLRNPAGFYAHLPEPLDNVVGLAPSFKSFVVF